MMLGVVQVAQAAAVGVVRRNEGCGRRAEGRGCAGAGRGGQARRRPRGSTGPAAAAAAAAVPVPAEGPVRAGLVRLSSARGVLGMAASVVAGPWQWSSPAWADEAMAGGAGASAAQQAAAAGLNPLVVLPLLAYGVFYVTREVLDKGKKSAEALHILVPDEGLASELKRQLEPDAGSASLDIAFGKLAAKHSTCPSGKRQGNLGTFKQGMMVREFDDVVFSDATPLRTVMGPVKTQFGYHLIYVQDRF